jgi:hypothetical protein
VICQGATRKKTKRELESKVRQQASAMKVLLTEKEAASKKPDVLGQKYKRILLFEKQTPKTGRLRHA